MAQCAGTNAYGRPCNSSIVLDNGRCPAHGGVDMVELGRRGGKRSGELRRLRNRSLAQIVVDELEAAADPHIRRIRAALASGDTLAALQAVRDAAGVSEAETTRIEMQHEMRARRARSLENGARWRNNDDYEEL